MVYSDVVPALLLPYKTKYTIRDVNKLIVNSLFSGHRTWSDVEAAFIVKCSAIYHEVEYSKAVSQIGKRVIIHN